jgi:hypothetical protein
VRSVGEFILNGPCRSPSSIAGGYPASEGRPLSSSATFQAPNEAEAIKQAIKQFEIADPEKQERLVAQRVKYS